MQTPEKILETGLERLKLSVSPQQKAQLMGYLSLLLKWNTAYNLTGTKTADELVHWHILDSLTVAPYLQASHIIDIGTGAGFPGIPLAILFPQKHFHLLDSNGKKVRFLIQVKHELQLANVTPLHERMENFHPEKKFDGIISRAVSDINTLLHLAGHLCCDNGNIYAMKSEINKEELAKIEKTFKVESIHPLNLPTVEAIRNIIVLTKTQT